MLLKTEFQSTMYYMREFYRLSIIIFISSLVGYWLVATSFPVASASTTTLVQRAAMRKNARLKRWGNTSSVHSLKSSSSSMAPLTTCTPYKLIDTSSHGYGIEDFTFDNNGNIWLVMTTKSGFAKISPSGGITEFPFSGELPVSWPNGITSAPNGIMYFSENGANRIGKITSTGEISEYPDTDKPPYWDDVLGDNVLAIHQMVFGPDGNLWFAEFYSKIGRMTPSGDFKEFSFSNKRISGGEGITVGPDGNLWFTEEVVGTGSSKIGKITPAGTMTEYPVDSLPYEITTGKDGNLWFTAGLDTIGKITTSGKITEYKTAPKSWPQGIAAGPDGNIWFTETNAKKIGKITPNGEISEYPIPTAQSYSYFQKIMAGPDGNLWFEDWRSNVIARITPLGKITEFMISKSGMSMKTSSDQQAVITGSICSSSSSK